MRFIKKSGLLLILAAVMLATSCKKDDAPDPTEKVQLDKLSGTWSVSSAELDGTNRDDFSAMKLVISGSFNSSTPEGPYQYVVNGTRPNPSPWPASGSWIFGDGEAAKSIIIRDAGSADEVQMTYSTDGTTLTVSFNVTGAGWTGSARTEQVEGDWVFEFTLD